VKVHEQTTRHKKMFLKIVIGLFLLVNALTPVFGQASLSITTSISISGSGSVAGTIAGASPSISITTSVSGAAPASPSNSYSTSTIGSPSFNHLCGNGVLDGTEQCDPGSTLGPVRGRFPTTTCCNYQCNWKKPGDACGNARGFSCYRTPRCQPIRGSNPVKFYCTGVNVPKRRGAGCKVGTTVGICNAFGTCRV